MRVLLIEVGEASSGRGGNGGREVEGAEVAVVLSTPGDTPSKVVDDDFKFGDCLTAGFLSAPLSGSILPVSTLSSSSSL